MKRKCRILVCLVLIALSLSQIALAHPGKLDSKGGHKDNKNVSGLGSYHYHCGDNPPHLHGPSGLCPYSKEYKEYKVILDELKMYVEKVDLGEEGILAWELLTQEDADRIQTLLLNPLMPFKLNEETLNDDTTMYGKTNVKGLNVRKKASTGSAKVCAIPVTGSALLITQDMDNGWYSMQVFENNKNYTGYVKSDMVDLIQKPEYLLDLCRKLV